jgi:SPP1 gp7 family putative phage head morphogenesis protein
MTNPQQKIGESLAARQIKLLRLAHGKELEILNLLQELFDRVSEDLRKRRKPATPRMIKYQKDLSILLSDFPEALANILDIDSLVASEMQHTATAINAALEFNAVTTTIAAAAASRASADVIIQGTPVAEWLEKYTDDIKAAIVREVRLGIAGGQSIRKTADRMEDLLNVKKSTARTLARTLTLGTSNYARQEYYSQYADNLIQGYIHDATLDSRTTKTCAVRDGLAWDKDKQPVGHNQIFAQPPLHPNCRSQITPWLYSAEKLPKNIRDKIPQGTRASMDGQLPATRNFQEWIDGKPQSFQEEWFGPGRYKLYKDGKINFQDLVDPTGRPLTLAELDGK